MIEDSDVGRSGWSEDSANGDIKKYMATQTKTKDPVDEIKREGEKAARKATFNPFVETLTRLGFAARGLIYATMGLLAVQVAIGGSRAPADQQGAIAEIGRQPFGQFLLVLIFVGLIGYALWGVIRAVFDPFHKGHDLKGIVVRIGYLISAASYAVLVVPTYDFLIGGSRAAHNGAQTASTQQFTAMILTKPWGRWAVGIVGLISLVGGLYQVYMGLKPRFEEQYKAYTLSPQQRAVVTRLGRFGTSARGVAFALVGLFLFLAAYRYDPHQARGIDAALLALARQPYGPWMVGIVAVGLIAFGIYSILGSLWFRLKR